jgi:hypothetical protein
MCIGLEMMEKVNKMVVIPESGMTSKLFDTFVRGRQRCCRGIGIWLCQALDSHLLLRCNVFSHEDHAERAMVQWSNATKPSVQDLVFDKPIFHALHHGGDRLRNAVRRGSRSGKASRSIVELSKTFGGCEEEKGKCSRWRTLYRV